MRHKESCSNGSCHYSHYNWTDYDSILMKDTLQSHRWKEKKPLAGRCWHLKINCILQENHAVMQPWMVFKVIPTYPTCGILEGDHCMNYIESKAIKFYMQTSWPSCWQDQNGLCTLRMTWERASGKRAMTWALCSTFPGAKPGLVSSPNQAQLPEEVPGIETALWSDQPLACQAARVSSSLT